MPLGAGAVILCLWMKATDDILPARICLSGVLHDCDRDRSGIKYPVGVKFRPNQFYQLVVINKMSTPTIEQLKQSDVPVILANHEGSVVDVNVTFEKVFGWTAEEIIGQPLTVVLPPLFHDSHNLGFARFAATGNSTILNHPLQLKAVAKNGQEIESEHFIIAEKQEGRWIFAATLRPL